MTGRAQRWPDALSGRLQSGRASLRRVVQELPRGAAGLACIAALGALALPAAALRTTAMLGLVAFAVLLTAGAVFAAAQARHVWLTPLPSIAAVCVTAVAVLGAPSAGGLLVGLVAVLIAAHLVALDLVTTRTALSGIRAEAGSLVAACAATGLTVLVAGLPALEWLWLAGVGLAAAAAAYVTVIGQRR
jgi:hypothetical protein